MFNLSKINSITKTATYRAMNKALAKTNTQFKRQVSKSTGLKAKDVTRRVSLRKASTNKQSASLSIGTRVGIPLDYFKAKVKVVKKNKRKYNGVSAVLPGQGRQLIAGAFFMKTKAGKTLVVKRRGKARMPVDRLRVSIYEQAVEHKEVNQVFMKEEFKREFSRQVKLLLQ